MTTPDEPERTPAKPSWGEDILAQPTEPTPSGETVTGWLSGLIKPEPQLPPRPDKSGSFSAQGNWLAGLISSAEEQPAPERPTRAGSPTGEVPLRQMMAKAQEVEEANPRAAPESPKPAPAASVEAREPSLAKLAMEPPKISLPQVQNVVKAAEPSLVPPARSATLVESTVSTTPTAQVDRVVTSVPKRSFVQAWSASAQRQRVSFYRSLTTMLGAGLPMFGVFDFLSRQAESPEQQEACRRISHDLVAGYPLHKAAYKEPALFSEIAVKLIEIGMRTGKLVAVLQRLAADEEDRWKMRQTLQSHLFYPLCIASLTLVAVVLLPPFVLGDLLSQVVRLTAEPPALTKAILWFSTSLSSPIFLSCLAALMAAFAVAVRSHAVRARILSWEPLAWEIPGLGELIRSAVTLRFLRVFAMTYDVGLTAPQCLLLAAEATGSRKVIVAGPRMKNLLIDGGTLKESLDIGDFLPRLVVEAMEAGQQSGDVSGMMESVARIVDSELEYRIETLMALIEPLFMAILGAFVGVFAIGCLLPILKLSESL